MGLIIGILGFFMVLGAIILYAGIQIGKHKHLRFAYRICRPERKVAMLELNCSKEEKIKVTVYPITLGGRSAQIQEGSLELEVTYGSGTCPLVENEGLAFWLVSGDIPEDVGFLVKADADLGEGIETISEMIVLHVSDVKAVNLGLVAESPVPK